MGKKLKAKGGKLAKLLDVPQRYAFNKLAEYSGAEKGKDAEDTAFNIVQKAADKLGLPDSTATNVIKSLGVAGLSTFADPVNLVPGGKIIKTAMKGASATKRGRKLASALSKLPKQGARISEGSTIIKNKNVQGKSLLPSGAVEDAALPLARAKKVAALGEVTTKKADNFAQQEVRDRIIQAIKDGKLDIDKVSKSEAGRSGLIKLLKSEE